MENIPPVITAARIDIDGNVGRYDFDTNIDVPYGEEPEYEDDSQMYNVLTNYWPEIEARLQELEMNDSILDIWSINIVNVKDLYEDHQEHLRNDPTMAKVATKVLPISFTPKEYP